MGIATEPARELASKIEVLQDLEEPVRELMESHERKRELWFPVRPAGPAAGRAAPTNSPGSLRDQAERHSRPDPRRARPQHADRRGAAALPPAARRVPGRRQLLARAGTICGRPRRTGTARCSTTTPGTPACSISGRSRRCSSSTSGPASTRSGTGTRTGCSPTPRCRSGPPSSPTARPAGSSASTSRAWPRS